ncbi:MAG: asparaginase [Chloroflexota bacterium]
MTSEGGRPRVVVVFTGGTISMLADPETGAARPALDGAAILARTPGLGELAEVEPVDWGLVSASHLSFDQILDIARIVRQALGRPDVDGAVVVQGTDTMEETAIAWDVLVDSPKPVVVVGAMRHAADPGYEGPANLRDAVRAAAAPGLWHQGTVVVMGGAILSAADVVKTDTDRYDAFEAPNLGPLGDIRGGEVRVHRRRESRATLPAVPAHAAEPVDLLMATVAADDRLARCSVASGARGIVMAAAGAGNTSPALLEAGRDAIAAGIPVVLATRVLAGRARAAYGFPGGGAQWLDVGAIPAGTLSGYKARVVLALALGAGLDDAALRRLFATLGA